MGIIMESAHKKRRGARDENNDSENLAEDFHRNEAFSAKVRRNRLNQQIKKTTHHSGSALSYLVSELQAVELVGGVGLAESLAALPHVASNGNKDKKYFVGRRKYTQLYRSIDFHSDIVFGTPHGWPQEGANLDVTDLVQRL